MADLLSPFICTRCGWHNEPTARICGGCGTPLRTTDPRVTSNADLVGGGAPDTPDVSERTPAPVSIDHTSDAPTLMGISSASGAFASGAPVLTRSAPPPIWAPGHGPAQAASGRERGPAPPPRRGTWWRRTGTTVVVLAVLAGSALGLWSALVRPALHAQADTYIRLALAAGIDAVKAQASQQPKGTTLQITSTASELEQLIRHNLPTDSPISDVHVHFTAGSVQILFLLNGTRGVISTYPRPQQGHLLARGTQIDFPLAFVESGDEMEAAFNDAFGRLWPALTILDVAASDDTLVLQVRT